MKRRFKNQKQASLILGYKSGLEEKISEQLTSLNIDFTYETEKIYYMQPAKKRSYKPDFIKTKKDGNKLFIETKGRLTASDRQKHEWVKDQYPALDIRFVFTNSNTRISKNSKTTYADWCNKRGFIFADKEVPKEWLEE
jgi:hypothetical protein